MTDDARFQCKEALLNRQANIHLCDQCRRKYCQSRDSLPADRRMIYCREFKKKTKGGADMRKMVLDQDIDGAGKYGNVKEGDYND